MTRLLVRLFGFACLWALLAGDRVDSWLVGVPVVAAATAAAVLMAPSDRWQWSVVGLVRFVPYFVWSSLLSGVDVSWRSLHPQLPIRPQLFEYRLLLPDCAARVFFMNVVNLLPGTVSADVRGDVLTLHVIDSRQPIADQLRKLERGVAALFAIPADAEQDGRHTS